MLTFILKNYWYDKIASGKKKIEYREVKPYWSKRLEKILPPDFLYESVKAFCDAGHEIAGIEFGEDVRPLCLLRRGFTRRRMTGNDLISARQLRQGLHKFLPTAQIIIVGNELPSFYKHDSGIIRRLLVFHFNIEHAKRSKDKAFKALYKDIPADSSKMAERIAAEAPGIVKLLCEKYIELKQKHDLNIPISQECENAKSQYIENQNKDTDKFYEACVRFTPSDDKAFVFSRQLYKCYLNFNGYQEGSSEALKQRNFIFYLKKDHPELGGQNYCQRRPTSDAIPEWGFKFISFTEEGLEYLNKTEAQQELPKNTEPPKDNPFDQIPPPPPSDLDPLTDSDGNDIDIF